MNICYIYNGKNDFYFSMLLKSIETLLYHYDNINDLYIFFKDKTNDITQIENLIIKYNRSTKLIVKYVDYEDIVKIKYPCKNLNRDRIDKIGLFKFYIPYYVDCEEILYIDCDVFFKSNVTNDVLAKFNKDKHIFKIWNGNSGVIYFNNILYKECNVLDEVIKYYELNSDTPTITVDNQAFAWLSFYSKFKQNICKKSSKTINNGGSFDDSNTSITEAYKHYISEINIIHLWGNITYKKMALKYVYNYCMN